MNDVDIFRLGPPDRKVGKYLEVIDRRIDISRGYRRIPGYLERLAKVRCGQDEPFWGSRYALLNGDSLPDLAMADDQQDAMSESLKGLLVESGAQGLHFYPIQVGETTMYILGVEGKIELLRDPPRFELPPGVEVAGIERRGCT